MRELITKSLRYDFTDEEVHGLSVEMAKQYNALGELIEEKKTVVAGFNFREKKIKAELKTLSEQVSNGYEFRDVECEVEYNQPLKGEKTITRKDTGEVFTQPMTEEDWTLFNQV